MSSSQVRARGTGAFSSRGRGGSVGRGGGRGGLFPVRGGFRGRCGGASRGALRGGNRGGRGGGGSSFGRRPHEPLVPKKVVTLPPPPTEAEMREATKMWIDKTREASDCELLDGMLPHIREHFALLGRPEPDYRICHIPVFAYGISVTVYSKKPSVLRDLIRACNSKRPNSAATTAEYHLPPDAKLRFNTAPISGEVWLQIEFDCHEEAEGFAKHVWVEWMLVPKGQLPLKMLILPDGLYLRDQRPTDTQQRSKNSVNSNNDDDDDAALSRWFERAVGQRRDGDDSRDDGEGRGNQEKPLQSSSSSAAAARSTPLLLESILRDRAKRARVDDEIPSTHHGCWNTGNLLHRRDGGGGGGGAASGSSGRNGDGDPTATDIREFTERLSADDLLLLRRLNISVGDVVSNPLRVENFALSELRDHRVDQSALLQLIHKSRTRLHCL